MAYVYRHIRLDKNEPFYIGISSLNNYSRCINTDRNNLWNKIVNKSDYKIEILLDNLTWEEACEKEKEFIKLYGRKNNNTGILANLTDGGEGVIGLKAWNKGIPCLEHVKKALSKKMLGSKPWNLGIPHTPNAKLKMSRVKLSKNNIAWNKGLKKVNGITNAKIILDFKTGIYYDSAIEASNILGYKYSTLKGMLNGNCKNKTNLNYV
jgi:hypothetical protein